MSPILPNSRTDLPADQPKHPFRLRLEQRRAEMVERVAAQAAEAAKAKATAETEALVRTKARDGAGGRLPHGIYRGSTPGTYRADAGRELIIRAHPPPARGFLRPRRMAGVDRRVACRKSARARKARAFSHSPTPPLDLPSYDGKAALGGPRGA
jgi:hypothetical protein